MSFDKPADNQSAAGDEEEKKRDGQDAGFATPTLKARVPASAKNVDKARQRSGVARERDTSRNTSQRAEEKIRRRGGASKKEKTEENQIANRRRKLEDYLLSQHQSAKKSSRKRQRSVESEREALLAERRERRRAKKAIVDPKRDDLSEEGDQEERGRKKRKEEKKTKLAAGLALMHGFSADNLGSGRITMKPSFGVFHKGKASAKTKVSKTKKATTSAWTELEFLGKTENKFRKRRSPSVDDSQSESEVLPARARSSSSSPPTKFKICNYEIHEKCGKEQTAKPKSAQKVSEGVESEPIEASAELAASESPADEEQRESVVWVVEGGATSDQVEDAETGPRVASSYVPQNPATLVLDTRTRWNLDIPQPDGHDPATGVSGEPDEASKVSYASLCPSQSASQVGRRISLGLEASKPAPTASKYFKGADLNVVIAPQSDSSETEGPAVRKPLPGTSSPPPLTHISSDHLDTGEPGDLALATTVGQYEKSIPDEQNLASPTSSELHQFHPRSLLEGLGNFVPASLLPRYPSSEDSMAEFEKLLGDSPGRRDLASAAFRGHLLTADSEQLEDFMDDEIPQQAFSVHYEDDDGAESLAQDVQSSELMYYMTLDNAHAAQLYDRPEEHFAHGAETYWTDEDAEYGPPLYDDAEAYQDPSPSRAYVEDPFFPADEAAEEDVEMNEGISWDPDAGFDTGEDARYDAPGEIYTVTEQVPPPSADASYVEPTESSSSDVLPEERSFGGASALLGRGLESRWADVVRAEVTRYPTVSKAEEDVAKGLRNHWLPQRL